MNAPTCAVKDCALPRRTSAAIYCMTHDRAYWINGHPLDLGGLTATDRMRLRA
ncbi:hypothetical protein FB554_1977 [Barrientosiimonas humi]|uniref:Uncharacterized protein n=1 Tax=Barrientosiimonas humi TaxID=999931 RepID=A0A542XDF4_9MICO|nr:hypothetical protein [Barrientosiimonas humi]TQL33824.1 hypothetical protein FB554_1977 [Barrientosiimonas humi]CAG7573812.1 hypothetical protein BH39T_PBIAJDOK_02452 [Barrientosiimonas humi]